MPRGTPDGRIESLAYAAQSSDLAYISNMLWGFSPIDGQGRPLYFDTFNNGLGGWVLSQTGAGQLPFLYAPSSGATIYSPPNAVRFSPGVAGGSDSSFIYRQHFLGVNLRLGLEAGIMFTPTTPDWTLSIDYKPSGKTAYEARLYFSHTAAGWRVLLSPTTAQTIQSVNLTPTNLRLMQIKIVGNWETGKYVRALIGDTLIDLSAYDMSSTSNSIDGFLVIRITGFSHGATTSPGDLGYAMLTRDEP